MTVIDFFYFLSAIGAVLFSWFRFFDVLNRKDEADIVKYKYHKIWSILHRSKINSLPTLAIDWFIKIKSFAKYIFDNRLASYLYDYYSFSIWRQIRLFVIVSIIWINEYYYREKYPLLSMIIFLVFCFLSCILLKSVSNDYSKNSLIRSRINPIVLFIFSCFIISIPIYILVSILGSISYLGDLQKMYNVFYYNIFFDTITIGITIKLLEYARNNSVLIQVFVIVFDLIISFLLTFLLASLLNSIIPLGLNQSQLIDLMIGKYFDNQNWLWIIYTIFLPTCLYLAFLIFAIFSKIIILPINKIIGAASINEKPHYVTATFFGALGLTFGIIGKLIDWLSS